MWIFAELQLWDDKRNLPPWFCLSSVLHSEFGGGPCSLAPFLTAVALLGASAQLHGTPVGGRGRYQHGAADSAQLRGESAETVLLVGHYLLLHHLPPLCHLLEHLCLRSAGGADTTSSLMKALTPNTHTHTYRPSTYTLTPIKVPQLSHFLSS